MKAGILKAKGDITYGDWPDVSVRPGTLKIKMRACGICGSDVPRVLGDEAHFFPIILGHEFAGEVADIGEGVEGFQIGDRIAGAPLIPCMKCGDCQKGNYALCKNYSFIGSREQGAFAEYVVIPASNAVKFDSSIDYVTGAMFEPATVALHGILHSGMTGGKSVAVLGMGNIGIFALQWARILGARQIAAFDVLPERLELAKSLGAEAAFNVLGEDCVKNVKSLTNGKGFDYVFETAGQPSTIALGYDLTDNKGVFTCVGTPHKDVTMGWKQWELMNRKEFRLSGTWMSYSAPFPGREWEMTAHYFASGELKLVDGMIFDTIPLDKISEAFELFKTPGTVKGKVIITNE